MSDHEFEPRIRYGQQTDLWLLIDMIMQNGSLVRGQYIHNLKLKHPHFVCNQNRPTEDNK